MRSETHTSLLTLVVLCTASAALGSGWPVVMAPDAGMAASIDAQQASLTVGTTRGRFEDLYGGNAFPRVGVERTVTQISSNGLFRIDYSLFTGPMDGRSLTPNLSVLFFRRPTLLGGVESSEIADWEIELAKQRVRTRGVLPPAQRSVKALRVLEQALNHAVFFNANAKHYQFSATNFSLSFVSLLPDVFPGVPQSGGVVPRRVHVTQQAAGNATPLILEHSPLLAHSPVPYRIVLARDAFLFDVTYFDGVTWTNAWTATNTIPRSVTLALLLYPSGQLAFRTATLPSSTVPVELQGMLGTGIGPTNQVPPPRSDPRERGRLAASPEVMQKDRPGTGKRTPWPIRVPRSDIELEWLGRSGVELARYILAHPESSFYDALNQKWAGGSSTGSPCAHIPLQDFPLGGGTISLRIADLDRKFSVNRVPIAPELLSMALLPFGISAAESQVIVDSTLDWIDSDDLTRPNGAESQHYLELPNPHVAKNGPVDDISELPRIRGIAPHLAVGSPSVRGLTESFTSLSGGWLNVNTADAETLQLISDVDASMAHTILQYRAGPDGIEGNEDDMPLRSAGEIRNIPGFTTETASALGRHCRTRSSVFEVTVDVKLGRGSRRYVARLHRAGSEVRVLSFQLHGL